jgi:predicted small secreted protein
VKKIIVALMLICFTLTIVGCGETISGAAKDIRRMGKGVKTVFIRDTD